MRKCFVTALALSALAGAAPVLAQSHSQLASSAGLTQEQAENMTLNEIAANKHNRQLSPQDQQTVFAQRRGDANPELQAFAVELHNANQSYSDRILLRDPETTSQMAFHNPIDVSSHYQLIRAAGLTPEEAEGMTLDQIVHLVSPGD